LTASDDQIMLERQKMCQSAIDARSFDSTDLIAHLLSMDG